MNSTPGQFTAPGEIRFQRLLPGPIERVWAYLVDSDKRSRWLARGPIEPRVGGTVRLEFHNLKLSAPGEVIPPKYAGCCEDGVGFTGRVTRWEPPRVLAHTWTEVDGTASEVTYELTAQRDEVLLVLVHRRLGDNRDVLCSIGGGWHTHLALLLAELAGTPKPSFWSTHVAHERIYEQLLDAAGRH